MAVSIREREREREREQEPCQAWLLEEKEVNMSFGQGVPY
jgi:hypothetical protein